MADAIPVQLVPRGNLDNPSDAKGRTECAATVDWTGAAATYSFDFNQMQQNLRFGIPRAMFIDNTKCANAISVVVSQTLQQLQIAPFSYVCLPIIAEQSSVILMTCAGGATALTPIQFLNFELPAFVASGFSPIVPGFQVESLPPTANPLNVRNKKLAPATAFDVFPAAVKSRMIRFRNSGPQNGAAGDEAYYLIGGAATGNIVTDTLVPIGEGGGEFINLPFRTAAAISFFSTGGTFIEAQEIFV